MVRLALAVLVASAALAAQSRPNEDKPFPNTKSFGRATIQFQDDTVHMMALYDYSQRNHDGAWLLLQTGVSVKKRTTVNRGNFHIEMPSFSQHLVSALGASSILPQRRFFEEKTRVLTRALDGKPCYILRVPEVLSADQASDDIVNHLDKLVHEIVPVEQRTGR